MDGSPSADGAAAGGGGGNVAKGNPAERLQAIPSPLVACGISTPIRNTLGVVVQDVERFTHGTEDMLGETAPAELILHPVGQLVSVRTMPSREEQAETRGDSGVVPPAPPAVRHFLRSSTPHAGVTAMAVAPNNKVIAVAERIRRRNVVARKGGGEDGGEGEGEADAAGADAAAGGEGDAAPDDGEDPAAGDGGHEFEAQVSIYHIMSGQRMKQPLHYDTNGCEWTSICFTGDSTGLVTASADPDLSLVLWQWRVERRAVEAVAKLPSDVTRVSCMPRGGAPCISTSGTGHLALWRMQSHGTEVELKQLDLTSKLGKNAEHLTDHAWLPLGKEPVLVAVTAHDVVAPLRSTVTCINHQGDVVFRTHVDLPSHGSRVETMCLYPEGILLAGSGGLVAMFKCAKLKEVAEEAPAEEGKEGGSSGGGGGGGGGESDLLELQGHITTGQEHHYMNIEAMPLSDLALVFTKNQRLLTVPLFEIRKAGILAKQSVKMGMSVDAESIDESMSLESGQVAGRAVASDEAEEEVEEGAEVRTQLSVRARQSLYKVNELMWGGVHEGAITGLTVCLQKPLAVTVGADKCVRVWNYARGACEICQKWVNDEPTAVAVHPMGMQIMVGFRDRVRLYNVLITSFSLRHEWHLKNCREIKYSHGGHKIAAAIGINVIVWDSHSLQQLHMCLGHIMPIKRLVWSRHDRVFYSTGVDGNVYGWDMTAGSVNDLRLDDAGLLNRSLPYLGMVIELADDKRAGGTAGGEDAAAAAAAALLDGGGSADAGDSRPGLNRVVVCGSEGGLRELTWDTPDSHVITTIPADEDGTVITTLELDPSPNPRFLYAGTSTGAVRVYEWPLTGSFREFPAHASSSIMAASSNAESFGYVGGIQSLALARKGMLLLSTGDDGDLLVQGLALTEREIEIRSAAVAMPTDDDILDEYNTDSVLVSQEFVDDLMAEQAELGKEIHERRNDLEFGLHRKETDWAEKLNKVQDERETAVASERVRFEKLQAEHAASVSAQNIEIDALDRKHIDRLARLENGYEGKLGREMMRYDMLKKAIEERRAACLTALDQQKSDQEREMRAAQAKAEKVQKEQSSMSERTMEECRYEMSMHRMVLTQQESEYESEVEQLLTIATDELHAQRHITSRLRAEVQIQDTKIVQVEKKTEEITRHHLATEEQIVETKRSNEVLQRDLDKLGGEIEEKQKLLVNNEKQVSELNSEHSMLESFRNVLDSKLNQMHSERQPLAAHVERLDSQISKVYEVLVKEFEDKKRAGSDLEAKSSEEEKATDEVKNVRMQLRERDRTIASWKRELTLLVESTGDREALVKMVDTVTHKFLGEKVLGETLAELERLGGAPRALSTDETAEELKQVVKERDLISSNNRALTRGLKRTKEVNDKIYLNRTEEQSWMIDECNRLRRENLSIRRSEADLEDQVEAYIARLTSTPSATPGATPGSVAFGEMGEESAMGSLEGGDSTILGGDSNTITSSLDQPSGYLSVDPTVVVGGGTPAGPATTVLPTPPVGLGAEEAGYAPAVPTLKPPRPEMTSAMPMLSRTGKGAGGRRKGGKRVRGGPSMRVEEKISNSTVETQDLVHQVEVSAQHIALQQQRIAELREAVEREARIPLPLPRNFVAAMPNKSASGAASVGGESSMESTYMPQWSTSSLVSKEETVLRR